MQQTFSDTFVLGHDDHTMALAKGSAPFDTTAGAGGGTSVINMSDADLDQISDARMVRRQWRCCTRTT